MSWCSYLQPPVQCPLDGDTLAGMGPVGGDSSDERVQLILLLLQLFHQALDGPLGKGFALTTLPVAHQAVHDAQAGVIAGRRVGDGHAGFRAWLRETGWGRSLDSGTGVHFISWDTTSESISRWGVFTSHGSPGWLGPRGNSQRTVLFTGAHKPLSFRCRDNRVWERGWQATLENCPATSESDTLYY